MIGVLVRGRVMIRSGSRVRVGVMFNVSVYHWNNCRRSRCRTFQKVVLFSSHMITMKRLDRWTGVDAGMKGFCMGVTGVETGALRTGGTMSVIPETLPDTLALSPAFDASSREEKQT